MLTFCCCTGNTSFFNVENVEIHFKRFGHVRGLIIENQLVAFSLCRREWMVTHSCWKMKVIVTHICIIKLENKWRRELFGYWRSTRCVRLLRSGKSDNTFLLKNEGHCYAFLAWSISKIDEDVSGLVIDDRPILAKIQKKQRFKVKQSNACIGVSPVKCFLRHG